MVPSAVPWLRKIGIAAALSGVVLPCACQQSSPDVSNGVQDRAYTEVDADCERGRDCCRYVTIPPVVGKSVSAAALSLRAREVKWREVRKTHTKADGTFDRAVGSVYATIPFVGARVCVGTPIWIYVVAASDLGCAGTPLPTLAGLRPESALSKLAAANAEAKWAICDVGDSASLSTCIPPPKDRSIAAAIMSDAKHCRVDAIFEPAAPPNPPPPPEPKCVGTSCEAQSAISVVTLVSGASTAAVAGGLLASRLMRGGQRGPAPAPERSPLQGASRPRLRIRRDIDGGP
jgi:hypothetical protein